MRKKKGLSKDIYLNDPINRLALEGASRAEIKEFLSNDESKLAEMKAKEFWSDFFSSHGLFGIIRVTTIAETDVIDYSHVQRRFAYDHVTRPKLPWRKIDSAFAGLSIPEKTIDSVIFCLKPFFHEPIIKQYHHLKKLTARKSSEFNKEIKRLSPLIAQLKQLRDHSPVGKDYESSSSLASSVKELERLLFFYRKIVDLGRIVLQTHYDNSYEFDKEIGTVSHQKHRFWNSAITRSVNLLNSYYHGNDCAHKKCKEIHVGSIKKVAELLKILYPTVWTENITVITKRIKTRYYANLP